MSGRRSTTTLGPLETAVMDRLWSDEGALDVLDVHRDVGQTRGVTRNTIHSTLERLVRKGLVSRSRHGRAYRYAALVSRRAFIRETFDLVVSDLGEADHAEVLVGFVDFAERADEALLERLGALVALRLREREAEEES
ncbi:MAG TPA: BlaI/MecI/CopY family transcriptional regulator [Myxococcota bacterium]|nr:BlaI/MecI/CopY family transcriptional regulator [Myxococcales bacterium]HPG27065.1 BlaI/MecI/CopY family transcriptional regulator [Myxococcota bacterium]